jgi:Zn ribbon nucleic-acid-binding protein
MGNFIRTRPRRVAAVEVKCVKCGHSLAVFERDMRFSGGMTYKSYGDMYEAGPAADPTARVAFACIPCDTPDHLVNWSKMEIKTAELLAQCKKDDTPRSVTFAA